MVDSCSEGACYDSLMSVRSITGDKQVDEERLLLLNVRKAGESTHLNLTMNQMQLVLNPPCVQRLLAFVKAMKSDAVEIVQVKKRSESYIDASEVQKSLGSIQVDLQVAAPKIIVPECYNQDSGVLVMDCGNIKIKGALGIGIEGGMKWDLSVTKIEAALPSCKMEMESLTEQSYLIHPFHIETSVQTIDRTQADMSVTCSVNPGIRGALDASKIQRLLRVLDVVVESFASNKADPVSDALSPALSLYGKDALSEIALSKPVSSDVPPETVSILINAAVGEIALDLHSSDVYSQDRLRVGITGFTTTVRTRPYDLNVTIVLQSLLVEDTRRYYSQISLAQSNRQEDLCTVSYTKILDVKSPLYQAFGTLVNVHFKTLLLNIDAVTISHLKPFLDALLTPRGGGAKNREIAPISATSDVTASVVREEKAKGPLQSMQITAKLNQVALELLETPSNADRGTELSGVIQANVMCFTATVCIGDTTDVHLVLESFVVSDRRTATFERPYSDLIRPLTDQLPSSNDTPLLTMNVKLTPGADTTVSMELTNLTVFFFPDLVQASIKTALENVAALTALFTRSPSAKQGESSSELSSSPPPPTLKCTVVVRSPRVVVLEEPERLDSRAIVAEINAMSVEYRQNQNESIVAHEARTTLRDVELYMAIFNSEAKQLQVVEPFTLDAVVCLRLENGKQVALQAVVECDKVEVRASLNDVGVMSHILERSSHREPSPKANHAPAAQDLAKTEERLGPSEVRVLLPATCSVKLNLTSLRILLLNDATGQSISVLRSGMEDFVFGFDVSGNILQAKGSFALAVDFLNPNIAKWEPVIERWFPHLLLSKEETSPSYSLVLCSDRLLQINVSGRMLRTVTEMISLSRISRRFHDRNASHNSLTFDNQTEFPLNLWNSRTGERLCSIPACAKETLEMTHLITQQTGRDTGKQLLIDLECLCEPSVGLLRRLQTVRKSLTVLNLQPIRSDSIPPHSITEEFWEYERRIPFQGSWGSPFLPGDPPKFTATTLDAIVLPSRWAWQDEWHVDTGGAVNGQVDSDSWEYATRLSYLGGIRRGEAQMLDQVRRRRWVRTRSPTDTSKEETKSVDTPRKVVWEVKTLEMGLRAVVVRAVVQVVNWLPFGMMIVASNPSWSLDEVLGPVDSDAQFSLPVTSSNATSIRFMRSGVACTLSDTLACGFRASDTNTLRVETKCNVSHSDTSPETVFFVLERVYSPDKTTMTIELKPHMRVQNALPCSLCVSISVAPYTTPLEMAILNPGETWRPCKADAQSQPRLSYSLLPDGPWSAPYPMWSSEILGASGKTVDVPCQGSIITFGVHVCKDPDTGAGPISVSVYPTYALIDRTDLQVCVRVYTSPFHGAVVRKGNAEQAPNMSPPHPTLQGPVRSDHTSASTSAHLCNNCFHSQWCQLKCLHCSLPVRDSTKFALVAWVALFILIETSYGPTWMIHFTIVQAFVCQMRTGIIMESLRFKLTGSSKARFSTRIAIAHIDHT
jgi:hypothetical protein